MDKMEPCPFCGNQPVLDTNGQMVWVFCYRCDVRGPREWSDDRNGKKKAIERWNRRWKHD